MIALIDERGQRSDQREQHAADRRRDEVDALLGRGERRDRALHAVLAEQIRERRRLRAQEHRAADREHQHAGVDHPQREVAGREEHGEQRHHGEAQRVADDHQPAAIDPVAERTGDQADERVRQQLEPPRPAERGRRTRQAEDQQRDRQRAQPVAQIAERLTRVEAAECRGTKDARRTSGDGSHTRFPKRAVEEEVGRARDRAGTRRGGICYSMVPYGWTSAAAAPGDRPPGKSSRTGQPKGRRRNR